MKKWIGSWEQKMSGEKGEITGGLTFKIKQKQLFGTTINYYSNGVVSENELYEIKVFENGIKLNGKWKNIKSGWFGQFEFKLINNNRFEGCYSTKINEIPNPKYYWNGEK